MEVLTLDMASFWFVTVIFFAVTSSGLPSSDETRNRLELYDHDSQKLTQNHGLEEDNFLEDARGYYRVLKGEPNDQGKEENLHLEMFGSRGLEQYRHGYGVLLKNPGDQGFNGFDKYHQEPNSATGDQGVDKKGHGNFQDNNSATSGEELYSLLASDHQPGDRGYGKLPQNTNTEVFAEEKCGKSANLEPIRNTFPIGEEEEESLVIRTRRSVTVTSCANTDEPQVSATSSSPSEGPDTLQITVGGPVMIDGDVCTVAETGTGTDLLSPLRKMLVGTVPAGVVPGVGTFSTMAVVGASSTLAPGTDPTVQAFMAVPDKPTVVIDIQKGVTKVTQTSDGPVLGLRIGAKMGRSSATIGQKVPEHSAAASGNQDSSDTFLLSLLTY